MEGKKALRSGKQARRTQLERREEAERRIIDATIRLMSKNGFVNLTMADIGEEAGYSRGLPAHYFGQKENLLIAVAAHVFDEYRRYAYRQSSPDNPKPTLHQAMRDYARAVRRNPDIARATVMLYTEALVNETLSSKLRRVFNEQMESIRLDLKEEIAHRARKEGFNSDPDIEAAKMFALLRGVLALYVFEPKFPLEEVLLSFSQVLAGDETKT